MQLTIVFNSASSSSSPKRWPQVQFTFSLRIWMAGLNSLAEAAPILLMLEEAEFNLVATRSAARAVVKALKADTVDADVETPQVAQLDFLSGQQLLPHAIHGHGEDSNDIRTLVHAAMTGYMLGKAVDVHHFRILRTCVRFFGNRLIGRIATHLLFCPEVRRIFVMSDDEG